MTVGSDLVATWDAALLPLHTLRELKANAAYGERGFGNTAGPQDFALATYSPDGELILAAQRSGLMELWAADLSTCFSSLLLGDYPVFTAAFSPDGTYVAAGTYDGVIFLSRVTEDLRLEKLGDPIKIGFKLSSPLRFHPDGTRLLFACEDGTVRELDLSTRTLLPPLPDIPGLFVNGLDLSCLCSDDLTAEDAAILRAYGANFPDPGGSTT